MCVGANRDEARDRPSSPPAVRGEDPRVLAPRDEKAGGTWLGYNEHGVLVAVTNRWVEGSGERSRGLLVADALGEPTATAALERVETELRAREYAPFYLVAVDEDDCFVVESGPGRGDTGDGDVGTGDGDGSGLGDRDDPSRGRRSGSSWADGYRVHDLEPGVHVVVNVGFDGDWFVPPARPEAGRHQAANAERIRSELRPRDGESADGWTRRVGEILGDHGYGVCVHGDGFGTRSSSLIRLGDERVFAFADGPPCEHPYEVVDDAL